MAGFVIIPGLRYVRGAALRHGVHTINKSDKCSFHKIVEHTPIKYEPLSPRAWKYCL